MDHLPLYRQIERYKREGVDITSSSISIGSVPVVID
ncbi:MAG: hypothetical protein IPN13_20935 [Bacteroidetes bacterium]|nr:hypothetical protein [Bacteroidota bacterium]